MKTLTFEKLIEKHDEDFYKENGYYLSKTEPETFALELMKQVRLATLEECANKADADVYFIGHLAELEGGDKFIEGEDYEVYVLKHSILDLDKNSIEVN